MNDLFVVSVVYTDGTKQTFLVTIKGMLDGLRNKKELGIESQVYNNVTVVSGNN